ncbi:MAG: oxidoreductase [Chloroflexi bacterium]|nr:oxidoreductase [Chloroflexota bacterium]
MWEFETECQEVIQRTPNIKSFRFPIRGKNVRYRPGQFFFFTIKIRGEEALHHFSFSSSPTEEGYIEFTKRITASDFSQALNVLRPGDWARLRGPEGSFTLPARLRPLALLSGGIGITPLRSMLRYIADKDLPFEVVLLYSNNSVEDIAFRHELDSIAGGHPGVRVEYVISGPTVPGDWPGKRGFITKDLVAEVIPDYMTRLFYISGPPRMVIALEEQLSALGVPSAQLKRDSFTGYD